MTEAAAGTGGRPGTSTVTVTSTSGEPFTDPLVGVAETTWTRAATPPFAGVDRRVDRTSEVLRSAIRWLISRICTPARGELALILRVSCLMARRSLNNPIVQRPVYSALKRAATGGKAVIRAFHPSRASAHSAGPTP